MARNIVKRHIAQVNRSYERYQRKVGVAVPWYEFDPDNSVRHSTYDEAGTRRWKSAISMPIMSVIRDEATQTAREEGMYLISTVHMTIGAEQARRAGLSDPYNSELHLNDRFRWDAKLWEVRRWQISGRLRTTEVVIGVDATEVSEEEMVNDPDFAIPTAGVTWAGLAGQTWVSQDSKKWKDL